MSKVKQAHVAMVTALAELQETFEEAQVSTGSRGCPSYSTACRKRLQDYIKTGQPCGISCPICLEFMGEIDKLKGEWHE